MKKTLFVFALILGVQNYAFSQKLELIKGIAQGEQLGFNATMWTNYPQDIKIKNVQNRGFEYWEQSNLFEKKKAAFLLLGGGLSVINLHTNLYTWSIDSSGGLKYTTENIYNSNKLTIAYLGGWAELGYHKKKDKKGGIKSSIGFRYSTPIDKHKKLKSDIQTTKFKVVGAIAKTSFGPTLRIGYRGVSVFGYFGLSSTFDIKKSDMYKPVSFGILLGGI